MKLVCEDCGREWDNKDELPAWHFGYLKESDGSWRIGFSSRYRCKGKVVRVEREDST